MLHKFLCREALPYSVVARVSGDSTSLAHAILLARFKWIVVKLRDPGAKHPHPASSFSLAPSSSLLETARRTHSRSYGRAAARKETEEAVILGTVSESTCES